MLGRGVCSAGPAGKGDVKEKTNCPPSEKYFPALLLNLSLSLSLYVFLLLYLSLSLHSRHYISLQPFFLPLFSGHPVLPLPCFVFSCSLTEISVAGQPGMD